jgi:hypothetical protein
MVNRAVAVYANSGNAEKFWLRVPDRPKDGCWIWRGCVGCRNRKGRRRYGVFMGNNPRRQLLAHRFAYALAHGVAPAGLDVLHRCDNELCVRQEHMFLGTCVDNVADRHAKGRDARGVRNGSAKLTPSVVRVIKHERARGVPRRVLARRFRVNSATIWWIDKGETWREVHTSVRIRRRRVLSSLMGIR